MTKKRLNHPNPQKVGVLNTLNLASEYLFDGKQYVELSQQQ